MTVGLVHLMVILTTVTTTLTVELIMWVRQDVAPEAEADPPRRVEWLGKYLEQFAQNHLEL